MLQSIRKLKGYRIYATDGEIGTVDDFLMDDDQHTIRYLVAQTGNWLLDRRVLINWALLGAPDRELERISVEITREQVENSPQFETALPLSRDHEVAIHTHYGLPYYWSREDLVGQHPPSTIQHQSMSSGGYAAVQADVAAEIASAREQPGTNLISLKELTGYGIIAKDGSLGHVEDFVVDDQDWRIRYLIVDTANWWPGKKMMLGISWMDSVNWWDNDVHIGLSREEIRQSPEYDPATSLNREYETKIHDFYGRPRYWD